MKSLFLPVVWASCYALVITLAMNSENKLGNAISSGIVKIQSSEVAFASDLNEQPNDTLSLVQIKNKKNSEDLPPQLSEDYLLPSNEMKSIWKALDKTHDNIPSHCLKAKQVLGRVIVNAKKRNSVNKSLAMQWVGHVKNTHCTTMEPASLMFG